jgi:predicted transcriptional regulator
LKEKIEKKLTNEEFMKVIIWLSDLQKRRLKIYFFDELNFREISKIEKRNESTVRDSLINLIEKLKNIFKFFIYFDINFNIYKLKIQNKMYKTENIKKITLFSCL